MLFRSSTVKHGSVPSSNFYDFETENHDSSLAPIAESHPHTQQNAFPKPSSHGEDPANHFVPTKQDQEKSNESRNDYLAKYHALFTTHGLPKKTLEEAASQPKDNRFSYFIQDDVFEKFNPFDDSLHHPNDDGFVTPSESPSKPKPATTPKPLSLLPESSLNEALDPPHLREPAALERRPDDSFHSPSRRPVSTILPSQDLFLSTPQQSPSKLPNPSSDFSFHSRNSSNVFPSPTPSHDSHKRSPSKHSLGKTSLSSLLRRPSSSYSPKKQSPGIHRRSLTHYFKFPHRSTAHPTPSPATVFGKSVQDLSVSYADDLCKFGFQPAELAPFPLLLPHIFAQCIHALSSNALHVPGIFRISGSGPIINAIMRNYYQPPHYWLDETSSVFNKIGFPTSIDIGGVLKRFIMVLPGGLLGTKDVLNMLVPLFLDESPSLPSDVWAELVAFAIGQIDSVIRFSLFCSLMALLRQVSMRTKELESVMEHGKESSLMKSEALGIIFGPLLLGNHINDLSKSNQSSDFNNLMHFETEKARVEARIVEGLINRWPKIISKLTLFNVHQSFPDYSLLNLVSDFEPAFPLVEEPEGSTHTTIEESTVEKSNYAASDKSQNHSEVVSLPSVSKKDINDSCSQLSTVALPASASTPNIAHIQEGKPHEQVIQPSQTGLSKVQPDPAYSRSEPFNLASQHLQTRVADSKSGSQPRIPSASSIARQPEANDAEQQDIKLEKTSKKKSSKGMFSRFFRKFKSQKKKH
ncbi:rho-type GTPase activating protein Rga6 [Schizosaccharomyces octosporus yFS286]|uniref:Rho-type GTPase activating protein Rga6 n=1 Tax=Schizosaccharomyces octosporus (strain yFS286) TaxID=483514 RepID=S9Q6G4_SCHOY|nr:rho-type GTPase activating protein Rga6 [Schizosaccharomyces octosporus yFS286]EPX75228.1 rho-type GTPase activating protein Rga6 [Schizosaccharomyces octosporus yFS286]